MRSVIVAAGMALVLAGCGGSNSSDGSADVQPLTTATTPATPTPSADGARPQDVRSDAGAIGFSEFAIRSIVATTGGADVEDFLAMSTQSCTGCITLAQQVGENPDVIQELDSPPTVSNAAVIKRDGDDYVVEQTVAMSAGRKVDTSDDSVTSTFDPITYTFVVRSTWNEDRWFISDYSVEKTS